MTTNDQTELDQAQREYQRAAEKVRRLEEQLAYWRLMKSMAEARMAEAYEEERVDDPRSSG